MSLLSKNKIISSQIYSLIFFILIVFAVALLGSFFKPDIWFATLAKPTLMPPSYVFPIVWTILYILLAFSGWLVWNKEKSKERTLGLRWYAVQLIANALWTYLFFGLHRIDLALIDILILIFAVAKCMRYFSYVSKLSFQILIPYLIWLLFAMYLNFSIYWINTLN